jgi:hypothetical protein
VVREYKDRYSILVIAMLTIAATQFTKNGKPHSQKY